MPVEQLNFQGINRAISDFGAYGACEELINLRPTTAGLVPVKPFSYTLGDITKDIIFVHKAAGQDNYIGITLDRTTNQMFIELLYEDGSHRGDIDTVSFSDFPELDKKDIHIAYTGNILLISILNKDAKFFLNLSYIWKSGAYSKLEANIPAISASISGSTPELRTTSEFFQNPPMSTETEEIRNRLMSAFNAIQEQNKEYCFGPIVVAIALKTNDGKTFWTSQWFIYDPTPEIKKDFINDFYFTAGPAIGGNNGFRLINNDRTVSLAGQKLTMTFGKLSDWNESTSKLKSIEVYASRPLMYMKTDEAVYAYPETSTAEYVYLEEQEYKNYDLDNQLLYLQKSITLQELADADESTGYSFALEFGGGIQMTNTTLVIDTGAVERFGKILSYNSRFHFYDSLAKVNIEMPGFSTPRSVDTLYNTDVFVVFNDGEKDITVYAGQKQLPAYSNMVISPDVRVKQVITQRDAGNNKVYRITYKMNESPKYNYSFNGVGPDGDATEWLIQRDPWSPSSYDSIILIQEDYAINVTEQFNPFVFGVSHSYSAPGKVLDIQPQMVAVKDVSFGDYPLNVFTDRGVYALLQGSETTLYGNFKSVSNLVSKANSVPTENGTFFIASGALWVVAGSSSVLVSDALSLGPHKFIRSSLGYQTISMGGEYDITTLQSEPTFEEYVRDNAILVYNRFRDELYISNQDYDYSYALSLKYRQWFKIAVKFYTSGADAVMIHTFASTGKRLADFSDEKEDSSVLVHLQSRPFSISYQYTHIHRVIAMIRSKLESGQKLIVALYGSDDLQYWRLICFSSRSGEVQFSQIRTPSSARSWRYYTVCIGGECPSDTDFGPVLYDFQRVIRRIG